MQKAFIQHRNNGVLLTFPNGISVSTIWGGGSYSDNHDYGFSPEYDIAKFGEIIKEGSDTVECMIWDNLPIEEKHPILEMISTKYAEYYSDPVYQYVPMNVWLEIIEMIKNHK